MKRAMQWSRQWSLPAAGAVLGLGLWLSAGAALAQAARPAEPPKPAATPAPAQAAPAPAPTPAATPTPAPAAAPAQPARRGFVWEARRGSAGVVLMGTIHVGRPDFYPLHPEYMARIEQAERIVLEADTSRAEKIAPLVERLAFYPQNTPGLDTRLTEPQRKRLDAVAARVKFPTERMLRMKPWFLASNLVVMEALRSDLSPAYATEAFLMLESARRGKALGELESVELQLRLFDTTPEPTQLAYLDATLTALESGDTAREARNLVDAWARGDDAEMERLLAQMRDSKAEADRFIVERIVDGRHPAMLDGIERLAAGPQRVLVAVGSLHFFGPKGLLAGLRERGWTITRL